MKKTIKCNLQTTSNGDGLWGCPKGVEIKVNKIVIETEEFEGDTFESVWVYHNQRWEIYTDKALPKLISDFLGRKVDFTEQGMQANKRASMEFHE